MTDYHVTKFSLIWRKESKVTEGGGGGRGGIQVENVLNRPGEIGLNYVTTFLEYRILLFTDLLPVFFFSALYQLACMSLKPLPSHRLENCLYIIYNIYQQISCITGSQSQ